MIKDYEKYKESRVEWIGKFPDHWRSSKLKWLSKIYAGGTPSTNIDAYWENGAIPWLNSGTVNQKRITTPSNYITEEAVSNSSTKWVPKGSLLMALAGQGKTKGIVATLEIAATCNQSMAAIVPDATELNNMYLFFWLDSNYERIRGLAGTELRDGLNLQIVGDIQCPIPPFEEQTKIARYLDYRTSIIDSLIQQKEKLIELFKEKRQADINEAVTKGLNPNAKMKNSGIEWLGEVPEHWYVKRIKHIKSKEPNAFVDGPFGSNLKSEHFIDNGDVYVVESGFITSGSFEMKKDFKTISDEHYQTINRSTCTEGDIIIAKIGANYGMSGILPKLDKPSVVSGNSLKLTIDKLDNDIKFIHYYLLNLKQTGSLELIVNETAQPALSLGTLNNVAIAVPQKKEQEGISSFIENTNNKLFHLISQLNIQIEKLKEYRQSLISETVTGKIDVRD